MLTASSQQADSALFVTLFKNGVATTLSASVTAGGAAGTYSDTTHSVSVVAGDKIKVVVVNGSEDGASAVVVSVSFQFQ